MQQGRHASDATPPTRRARVRRKVAETPLARFPKFGKSVSARGGHFSNPQQQVSFGHGWLFFRTEIAERRISAGWSECCSSVLGWRVFWWGGTARFAGSHCRDQLSNIIGQSFIFYFAFLSCEVLVLFFLRGRSLVRTYCWPGEVSVGSAFLAAKGRIGEEF